MPVTELQAQALPTVPPVLLCSGAPGGLPTRGPSPRSVLCSSQVQTGHQWKLNTAATVPSALHVGLFNPTAPL